MLRTYTKISKLTYFGVRRIATINPTLNATVTPPSHESGYNPNHHDQKSNPINFSSQYTTPNEPYGHSRGNESSYSSNYDRPSSMGREDSRYGQNPNQYQSRSSTSGFPSFKDPITSTIELAGAVADNAQQFAKSTVNFAVDFVGRVTGGGNPPQSRRDSYEYDRRGPSGYNDNWRYDNYRNDNYRNDYNRREQPSGNPSPSFGQDVADGVHTAAQNLANTVHSAGQGLANMASSFIPGGQQSSASSTRDNYNNNPNYNYNVDYYQYGPNSNNPYYRAQESSANPQYFTSNNPQYTSFSSSGPTSGFGRDQPTDYSEPVRNFVDNTAQNLKGYADQAANTARDFVDRGFSNTAANMASSTVKGFADSAYSMASSFIPGSQPQGRYDNRYNTDYRNRYDYDRRDQNQNPIGNAVENALRNASDMAQGAFNVASSIGSSFFPGMQSQSYGSRGYQSGNREAYETHESYRDRFVNNQFDTRSFQGSPKHFISTNTQFAAFNPNTSGFGNTTAYGDFGYNTMQGFNDFANQAKEGVRDFVDQNAPYGGRGDYYRETRQDPGAGDVAGAVVNAAGNTIKGIADTMFSIASSFVPGSQTSTTQQQNDPSRYGFQGGSYNSRR